MKLNLEILVAAALLASPACFATQAGETDDAETAQALPALSTVLERIAEQAQNEAEGEREFKQRYSYTRSKVTEYRDGDGEVQKREEKKRTSQPKSPPPQTAQTSKSSSSRSDSKSGSDGKLNPKDKVFEKSDFAVSEDLLDRFDFKLIGRETIDGRPALVIDFKPAKKDLPERNFKDKFINKAAGRVWVDEADYALVKANLYLTERVNVVGGLVGAIKKFNYSFDRERTDDGIWYARNVKWHLEGRELFFRRTIDYHEENTDVKKVW